MMALAPDLKLSFSEDCLYLNVFVPDGTPPPEGWAVMVWFHSGDFNTGAIAMWDASVFAVKQKVIVVTPSYRLNVFGFLTLRDSFCPGNLGLLDQVAALEWVSTKISAFGGASNSVCVAGHGAGGSSVTLHMLSPLSAGKFHRAISMSGSGLLPSTIHDPETLEKHAVDLGEWFICDKTSLLDCLRNIEAEAFMVQALKDRTWGPVVDRDFANVSQAFLPKEPLEILSEGIFNKVPFMVGYTNMEDALLKDNYDGFTYENFQSFVAEIISTDYSQADINGSCTVDDNYIIDSVMFFYELEPSIEENSNEVSLRQTFVDFTTEKLYGAGAYQQAASFSHVRPTFIYRFDYKPKRNFLEGVPEWVSVPHQFELPFVWGVPHWPTSAQSAQTGWHSTDKKITDIIMSFWSNFVKFSNPVQNSMNIKWEPFDEKNPSIMIIDKNFDVRDSSNFNFRKFYFWNYYYPKVLDISRSCCTLNDTSSHNLVPSFTLAFLAGAQYFIT
ncbi:carboxylesterase 5A-like [Bacillus rossius redtenbacheri]|uniref:carboxylesterase 5A-like n=1 Tax=Bacillus rossius redtenbacheri TaxID=93214 RepID=UPI002FDDF046